MMQTLAVPFDALFISDFTHVWYDLDIAQVVAKARGNFRGVPFTKVQNANHINKYLSNNDKPCLAGSHWHHMNHNMNDQKFQLYCFETIFRRWSFLGYDGSTASTFFILILLANIRSSLQNICFVVSHVSPSLQNNQNIRQLGLYLKCTSEIRRHL